MSSSGAQHTGAPLGQPWARAMAQAREGANDGRTWGGSELISGSLEFLQLAAQVGIIQVGGQQLLTKGNGGGGRGR